MNERRKLPDQATSELVDQFKDELSSMIKAIKSQSVSSNNGNSKSFWMQVLSHGSMVIVAALLTYFFTTKSLATIQYVDNKQIEVKTMIKDNAKQISENSKQVNQLIGIMQGVTK